MQGTPSNGEEVTHLPNIVEAAESSPAAALAAAYTIRKQLKESYSKPYIQYNAIMLIRILADNPGPTFTKGFDDKFVKTIGSCLISSGDPSVQQILRETLHNFDTTKANDPNLAALLTMWHQEMNAYPGGRAAALGPVQPHPSTRPPKKLPAPAELAARIAEAKTSAQLLIQLSQTTPPEEVPTNELMKEFADRCQTANRNLHGYMNCTDPSPDEQTFQTLIETCEQLSVASTRYQRAVLESRKKLGPPSPQPGQIAMPPLQPTPQFQQTSPPPQQQQQQQQQNTRIRPSSATNPFSDENQIPNQPHQNGFASTTTTTQPPPANTFELHGSADERFDPPTGPPPGQVAPGPARQPYEYTDDDADLYGTGSTPRQVQATFAAHGNNEHARPEIAQPTASYVQRQDRAVDGLVMSGGNSPPPAVNRGAAGARRIRDDD